MILTWVIIYIVCGLYVAICRHHELDKPAAASPEAWVILSLLWGLAFPLTVSWLFIRHVTPAAYAAIKFLGRGVRDVYRMGRIRVRRSSSPVQASSENIVEQSELPVARIIKS